MTLTSLNFELKINICIRLSMNNVYTVINYKYCGFHNTPTTTNCLVLTIIAKLKFSINSQYHHSAAVLCDEEPS